MSELRERGKQRPFVGRLMLELAEEAGVRVIVEPRFGYVGQIICPNGKVHYFRNTHFDLNPLGATEISRDKDYASFFMAELGYPVIEGEAFYSKEWCEAIGSEKGIDQAYAYACSLGLPAIVKPNSKSQGVGVYKVTNKSEFYRAMRRVFKVDHVGLVQRFEEGNDYRIVVLDGRVISAYQRLPLTVVGDGIRSVGELHNAKQAEFQASERDTILKPDDFRLKMRLRQLRMSMETVLPAGQSLRLLDNANLCSGGTSIDVTDRIHPNFEALCARLTADMGLRYCGVDLMIDGLLSEEPGKYAVIEINAAPGIDNYAAGGPEQEKIVRGLYLEVLKALARL
jgi:D-alanine-D-alanine ligase-like ATP-grasp enzyme